MSYTRLAAFVLQLLPQVDAVEIHTRLGHLEHFRALWSQICSAARALEAVAVSFPDLGDETHGSLQAMERIMPCRRRAYLAS